MMADARALLQQQRASRRITHPLARYTDSNKLLCTICDLQIKSESSWTAHLKTPDHAKRVLRAAEAQQKQQAAGRKRKADSEPVDDEAPHGAAGDSEAGDDARKRVDIEGARSRDETPAITSRDSSVPAPPIPAAAGATRAAQTQAQARAPPQPVPAIRLEEDADWLELQTMLDDARAQTKQQEDALAHATISAPAMTAAEIAARAREEQSVQRGKREKEIEEEEREDAAARLEEEVEEMGGLEERVKRLRERREGLRAGRAVEGGVSSGDVVVADALNPVEEEQKAKNDKAEDEDEEDDEDDDIDEWNFGAD